MIRATPDDEFLISEFVLATLEGDEVAEEEEVGQRVEGGGSGLQEIVPASPPRAKRDTRFVY